MPALFPKWMNALPTLAALGSVGGLTVVVGAVWYWATPEFWEVGYMPSQPALAEHYIAELKSPADPNERPKPIPGVDFPGFSHQIHAGKLGIDCRYCHTKVEQSSEANIPNVATCFGCHAEGHVSREIARDDHTNFIRLAYTATTNDAGEAIEGGASIPWKRVHKLPDYVRNFPHNVHVRAGVSCFFCHGQIAGMPVVHQEHSLSMSWCLDCHRTLKDDPHKGLVPPDKVTRLVWVEQSWSKDPAAPALARQVYESLKLAPPENCGACHY
ncbi:MAG: cytochrome c3 family protein [Phycisphaerales bacterium]